jgi:hypothetical protein
VGDRAAPVAAGLGPVLQAGAAPVEGYSNPAWLALLVVGHRLGVFDHGTVLGVPDQVLFPKALGLLLVAVVFAALYSIAQVLTPQRPALTVLGAGAVLAAIPSFVIWTVSGLENPLLAATTAVLAAVLVRAAVQGRQLSPGVSVAAGLLAAVAALTRPDGLIYATAHPLVVLLFARRGTLGATVRASTTSLLAFALPYGTYLLWRLATFGELLPNTALAKSQGVPAPSDLNRPAEIVAAVGWLPVVLGAAAVGAVLTRSTLFRRGVLALLVMLVLAVGAFVVLEPDWMGQLRFATPVWPTAVMVVAVAVARIVQLARWPGRVAAAALAAVVAASSGGPVLGQVQRFRAEPTVPMCVVAETGRVVEGYADLLGLRSGTVLTPDIGGVALASRMVVVDTVGLAEPRIALFWRSGDMAGLRDHVFDDVRPTFVTSHTVWSAQTGIPADPRMARDYVEIATINGSGQWVRRDALADPAELGALRRFAAGSAQAADDAARAAPRSSCGPISPP